jgi:hypothetical protein
MKSLWSVLCAPGFVLSVFCSPPGSSCANKSHWPQASNVSREPNPRKWRARNVSGRLGASGSTLSGSANLAGTQSVGGGHKPRALAHGYSSPTPSGFRRTPGFSCYSETLSGARNRKKACMAEAGLL